MVGVIEESGRLPGSILLASDCTRLKSTLGAPGRVVKSSISSLSRKPRPGTVTPLPKNSLMV
jgi:hypothetical protein